MSNTKTEAQRLGDWLDGFHKASVHHECAAELRRLDAENQQLKASLALVQQHHATAWNRGHQAGIRADESAVKQAIDAVRADAWGNTQLTNALMQAEAERDQLRAQVERLQGGEPVNRPQNCGTSFCSCIECVCEPSQEPLTNFDAIPDEVIDTAQEKSGMYRVELMRAWDAIIAALREKDGK